MKARSRSSSIPKKRSNPGNGRNSARWTRAAVLRELKSLADPKVRAKMAYFGVNVPKAYGISAPVLHSLAKRIGKDHRRAQDFDSWDVVDAACCYLYAQAKPAWSKAGAWSRRREEFVKRASFSLIAYLSYKDKAAPHARFARFLRVIEREAQDERSFVKKAINWALRNIGKRNVRLNREAIRCAERIQRQDSRAARWIAADALRELKSAAVQARLRRKAA